MATSLGDPDKNFFWQKPNERYDVQEADAARMRFSRLLQQVLDEYVALQEQTGTVLPQSSTAPAKDYSPHVVFSLDGEASSKATGELALQSDGVALESDGLALESDGLAVESSARSVQLFLPREDSKELDPEEDSVGSEGFEELGSDAKNKRTKRFSLPFVTRFTTKNSDEKTVPFENVFVALIALQALLMGVGLQYRSHVGDHLSWALVVDTFFTTVFVLEIAFRVRQQRSNFFLGMAWRWNVFDFAVVLLMALDKVLRILFRGIIELPWNNPSHLLSTLRMFRLVFTLQAFRILRSRHVRLFVLTFKGTVEIVLVTMAMLLSGIYVVGLIITNGVLDHCSMDHHQQEPLCVYFGTLYRSCFSACKAVLGGVDWGTLADALSEANAFYAVLFVGFTVFIATSIMQVATGMIVNLARDVSKAEKKHRFIQDHSKERRRFLERMQALFEEVDLNNDGEITKAEMRLALKNEQIRSEFVSMELDMTAADTIFELIDADLSGFVSLEEFCLGCLRLQGKARAVDVEKARNEIHALQLSVDQLDKVMRTPETPEREERGSAKTSYAFKQSTTHRSVRLSVSHTKTVTCIQEPELRAMLVDDLELVAKTVEECCEEEAWIGQDGPLEIAKVNLYDFTFHYIAPRTIIGSITLVGLAFNSYKSGQILMQFQDDERLCAKAEILEDVEGCDVCVRLLKGQFRVNEVGEQSRKVLLDGEKDCGNPSEIRLVNPISYKELVSPIPTPPQWFVCHWWGEPVLDFVQCCQEHATRRNANSYWVCAYANRQHDLGADIGEDPENSSFRRAMINAEGLLLLLDTSAVPFQRIWCCFELFKTVTNDKTLDIITMAQAPRLLTQKPLEKESAVRKFLREKEFPISVLTKGIRVQLENGNASVPADKTRILNSMGKDPTTGIFSVDLQKSMIDFANRHLRGYLAIAAWPQAIKRGRVMNFHSEGFDSDTVSLPKILREDTDRSTLEMSFNGMVEVTDYEVASISRGLPPNVSVLKLGFDHCVNISDMSLESLADAIEQVQLQRLTFDFQGCHLLTDRSISYLAAKLPATLSSLSLQFALIPKISKLGAKALADNLPPKVSQLQVSFRGSKFDHEFESIKQLKKMTR